VTITLALPRDRRRWRLAEAGRSMGKKERRRLARRTK